MSDSRRHSRLSLSWRAFLAPLVLACIPAVAALGGEGNAPPPPADPPAAPDARKVFEVTSADGLVDAIGPDRIVRLAPGEYNLSRVKQKDLPHVAWKKAYDGWDLWIGKVANLKIEGAGDTPVRVLVSPRYAYVLNLSEVEGLEFVNLELGHAPEPGFCEGGIVNAAACKRLAFRRCVLFGCGTEGLTLRNVSELAFDDSVIRDCTYGILTAEKCRDLVFRRSAFKGNREFHGFILDRCGPVRMEACSIVKNQIGNGDRGCLFQAGSGTELTLDKCKVLGNRYRVVADPADALKTVDTEIRGK
jgi:hypothetical protein